MVDERQHAIAAVHAGWRGTARCITPKVVKALTAHFASRPEDLLVTIGPGICSRCYTVGPEVARQFQPWFPELAHAVGQTNLDLAEANRRQLLEARVPAGRIYVAGLCSSCRPEDFFSYRRDPHTPGRMLSAIGLATE
jgi:YfiH family protein